MGLLNGSGGRAYGPKPQRLIVDDSTALKSSGTFAAGRALHYSGVVHGWYASVENFKKVWEFGWIFVTRFKGNRQVHLDHGQPKALAEQPITATGTVVWLPGYGEVKVF